jgi:hypothetical protein
MDARRMRSVSVSSAARIENESVVTRKRYPRSRPHGIIRKNESNLAARDYCERMKLEGEGMRTPAHRWILVSAIVATVGLLLVSIYVALAPLLVFHSRSPGLYSSYHQDAPVIALVALIPANVWAMVTAAPWAYRTLGRFPRAARLIFISLGMAIATVMVAGVMLTAFVVIAMSTTDWFQF